jgi:hypothetical protein
MPPDGLFVNAEQGGDFVMPKATKKAQLHDLRFLRILGGQSVQGFIHLQNLFVIDGGLDGGFMKFHALSATATLEAQFAPGVFNKNASHRFGCRCQKMSPVLPLWLLVATEPQPGLMDQSRGLKRLAGGFPAQLAGSNAPQFVI